MCSKEVMDESNGGHSSDTDVSAQMAPGVSPSLGTLVSSTIVNAHQVSLSKLSSLDYGGKYDAVAFSSEVQIEAIVSVESSEKPCELSENGGLSLADVLKTHDKLAVDCKDADVDVEKVPTVKALNFAESPQANLSLVNGVMLKENGVNAKDLGVVMADSLDDDQPLCMVFKKGKLGEHGLAARSPTEELSSCPHHVLPSSFSSPGIDRVKTSSSLSKADLAEGVVKKTGQGEGAVVKPGTLKSRHNNGLERSRKGSIEMRRAPRQVKKRRYW